MIRLSIYSIGTYLDCLNRFLYYIIGPDGFYYSIVVVFVSFTFTTVLRAVQVVVGPNPMCLRNPAIQPLLDCKNEMNILKSGSRCSGESSIKFDPVLVSCDIPQSIYMLGLENI